MYFFMDEKIVTSKCSRYIPNFSPSVGAARWEGIRRQQVTLWSSRWHPTTLKLPGAGKCNKYITASYALCTAICALPIAESWGVRKHSFTNPMLSLFVVPAFWDEKGDLQLLCSPRVRQPTVCLHKVGIGSWLDKFGLKWVLELGDL